MSVRERRWRGRTGGKGGQQSAATHSEQRRESRRGVESLGVARVVMAGLRLPGLD